MTITLTKPFAKILQTALESYSVSYIVEPVTTDNIDGIKITFKDEDNFYAILGLTSTIFFYETMNKK